MCKGESETIGFRILLLQLPRHRTTGGNGKDKSRAEGKSSCYVGLFLHFGSLAH